MRVIIMKVEYYTSASGRNIVLDYLLKQDARSRAQCNEVIEHLRAYGFQLPPTLLKKISGQHKLWELRISGSVEHRILFTLSKNGSAIALSAFTKKTQQTPLREIKTAVQRRKNL